MVPVVRYVCVCMPATTMSCGNADELMKMAWRADMIDPRNHVLGGVHIGGTWQIRLNDPGTAAMLSNVTFL